jgi:Cobalamin biosynthesis protein CobT VWA domain
MSTTDVFTTGGDVTSQDTDEKARAAVKAFRHLQPTLTSYARILTGKPNVRVEMSATSNGMTDGTKIFYRPPMALGDNSPHDRRLCDKRDPATFKQLCPACRIREMVLVTIYHEIGHIAHDSFAKTTDYDRAQMMGQALKQVDKKFAKAVQQKIERTPSYVTDSYIGMAGMISPFLPGIVNALDDARVNKRVMEARQGTVAMFKAYTFRVFGEGVEQKDADGKVITKHWRDYPLNMQAAVAIFCKASGYDISEWLVEEVVQAMEDEEIKDLLSKFKTVRNVSGTYALSIPLLARLRQLGFFKADTDPVTEEEEENGDDEGSEEGDTSSDDGGDRSGDQAELSDSSSDPGQEQGDEGEAEGDSPSQSEEEGDGGGTPDPDSDGEGESGLDEESDAADAGVGESDSSEGTGDEAEASSDGSEGSADDGTSSDESGGGSSENDGDVRDDSDQQDDSEGDGSVDESSEDASSDLDGGEGSGESGDGTEGQYGDEPPGAENASGAGGDHDSSEAGSDVQGLEDGEVLGEPSDLREPDPVSGDGLDSDSGTGDLDGPVEEDDGVRGEVLDEREDGEAESSGDDQADQGDPEPIDTGADEGLGGVELKENSAFDRLPMGTPEEVESAIHEFGHPEDRPDYVEEGKAAEEEIERAIIQGLYFETPSRRVFGVREHYWDSPVIIQGHNMSQGWDQEGRYSIGYTRVQLGIEGDFHCDEKTLGPALLRMRVAFADNQKGADIRHRKSGKVDGRVLGKRAHSGDERLFRKRIAPGKKDYFVLIGIDISGSTIGRNIALAKRAAMAQATLCHRMGIKFAVFAHSGKMHDPRLGRAHGVDVDIYHLKDPDEPWTDKVQSRLLDIGPDSANLDGHTFEYYRRILDKRSETHKVMLYYTDGKMPAENAEEELVVLQREIKTCKHKQYVLIGVGIRTDSPKAHGLDTVRVDGDEDIIKVVRRLEQRLLAL